MRNVSGRPLWSLLSSLFILSGCTGAVDPSVSFLSFSLPSLKNTGTSPFQQELQDTGYIALQGTCDKAVTNFQFQMDQNGWKEIPSSPGMAPPGVTLPTQSYDVDCSDGTFFIYLLEDEIQSYLLAGVSLDDYHPAAVHLRGVAGPFTTDPLTFYQDENTPEANSFVLLPLSSKFDVGLCVPVDVRLVYQQSGQSGWSGWVVNSQNRQISLSIRDFNANGVQFYTDSACQTGLVSNVVIPKSETSKTVYLKGTAATEGYIEGTGVGFGGSGADGGDRFITIDSAGTPYQAKFADISRRPDAGSCEDVLLLLYDDNGVLTGSPDSDVSVQISKSSGVTLYANGSCHGTALTDEPVIFPKDGNPWLRVSYKVSETTPKQLSIPSGGSLPATETSYHYINPWMAAHKVVLKSAVPQGLPYQAPDCVETKVSLVDKNGNPQNLIQPGYSFDYKVSAASFQAGLYSNADCSGTSTQDMTLTFEHEELEKTLYWKLEAASTMTTVQIAGWEEAALGSPFRLQHPLADGLEFPVVANLKSLGGGMRQVFRLPRVALPDPLGLASMGLVKDLSDSSDANTKMDAFYSDTDPAAVYVGKSGGRTIEQQVLDLGGEDGFSNSTPSTVSPTSGYVAAIMFQTSAVGTQTLMGFPDQSSESYVMGPAGTINFMGCSMGSGLNDGQWHILIVGRPALSVLEHKIFYQLDENPAQECALDQGIVSSLTTFTAPFAVGKLATPNPGLNGQIAEVLFDDGQWISGISDPLFQKIRTHLSNRYPR